MKKIIYYFFAEKDLSSFNYTDTNRNVDVLIKDKKKRRSEREEKKKGLTY